MTLDYLLNTCSFSANVAFTTSTNIQGYRKGLYVELFCMFFIYFLSQALHTFRYKHHPGQPQEQSQQPLQPPKEADKEQAMLQKKQETFRPQLPWNQRRWNRLFPIMFSNHAIALGMLILFSPLPGGLICAYIHLVFFVFFVISELMLKKFLSNLLRIGKSKIIVAIDLLNLTIILIGVTGVNYAQYLDGTSLCIGYPLIRT